MLPLLTPEMMVVGTSDDTEELVELPFKLDVAVLFATDEGVTPLTMVDWVQLPTDAEPLVHD